MTLASALARSSLAAASLWAGLSVLPAAAEKIAVERMERYCVGMASAEFGENPRAFSTRPVQQNDRGAYIVRGEFPGENAPRTFLCRFSPAGEFRLVRETTDRTQAGTPDTADETSAVRAGTGDFDATGTVPCRQYASQPMTQCQMGVAREGDGTATVVITKPDGIKRALFFERGEFVSADTSQADGYPDYFAEKVGDLYQITVGEEYYEFPEAVIFGG